jgi:hypothetical protein
MTIALAVAVFANSPARAEDPEISRRRVSARSDFTDEEIKNGLFKIAFGAELQFGAAAERVRKFDEPIKMIVFGQTSPNRRAAIAAIIADIRLRVNHLDIALTKDRREANFFIQLVAGRDLNRTIRALYGTAKAKQIQRSLSPQCLSGIAKDEHYRIRKAEVILPADAAEFDFYDCAYEEILQGLGAINDDGTVPWTMFNDNVQMGFFDTYDQYLLNILYDKRICPGMTKQEVNALMPDILPTARAWVSGIDSPSHSTSEAINQPTGAVPKLPCRSSIY